MSASTGRPVARGVVLVHSTPAALCPHLTWAIESVVEHPVAFEWIPQPASPRLLRAELAWSGVPGTGSAITSALRGWENVRFEVTEEPSPGADGSRWSYTPTLGIHHAWTSANGDTVVNEDRIREALAACRGDLTSLTTRLDSVLGAPWDRELEPFRYAGDGAPVRWLHKVG